jgi:hypothetical protein
MRAAAAARPEGCLFAAPGLSTRDPTVDRSFGFDPHAGMGTVVGAPVPTQPGTAIGDYQATRTAVPEALTMSMLPPWPTWMVS